MTYKIYAWGDGKSIAPFDVSSHILNHLIQENNLKDFELIVNSNIFQSHSGRLPYLVDEDCPNKQATGFVEILKIIKDHTAKSNQHTSPKLNLLYLAFLDDLVENLELITMYNFFFLKKNYEGFTRGIFQSYLTWPMQYKPPVDLRNHAIEICLENGIINQESVPNGEATYFNSNLEDELENLNSEEKKLRDTPVINELQKSQMDQQLAVLAERKTMVSNMQCLNRLKTLLAKFEDFKSKINDPVFELIVNYYMKLNSFDQLPEKFISMWLQREYPKLYKEVTDLKIIPINNNTEKVPLSTALKKTLTSFL